MLYIVKNVVFSVVRQILVSKLEQVLLIWPIYVYFVRYFLVQEIPFFMSKSAFATYFSQNGLLNRS